MANIKLVAAKCPSCGAGLQVPENLEKAHCVYCGAQVLIHRPSGGKLECKICDGFGRIDVCRACRGSGRCTWRASAASGHNDLTMFMTYGFESHCENGHCSACGGHSSGGVFGSCPYCGGNGICPWCKGNARCAGCDGLGVLRGPAGSQTCPGCGGKGYIEGEPPKTSPLDKCPECGRPMYEDMFFCAVCGFARGCPKCLSVWPRGSTMCPVCGYRRGHTV